MVERLTEFTHGSNGSTKVSWQALQKELESSLQRLIKRELQSNPMVLVMLQTDTPIDEEDQVPQSPSRVSLPTTTSAPRKKVILNKKTDSQREEKAPEVSVPDPVASVSANNPQRLVRKRSTATV